MNKFLTILISVAVSGFLALNFYLLFNEKSSILKSYYVHQYESVLENDYREELAKATLVAPLETYTVYVDEEDAVNSWLVGEGSPVTVGQELALLNTERAEGEREVWEAEREALHQQRTALEQLNVDLTTEKFGTQAESASTVDQQGWIAEIDERTTIELDLTLGMNVGITQEGAYSQAMAAVDQQIAEVSRQLTVIEAQLAQSPLNQALISPTEGVVSEVTRHGNSLAIDLYSEEKVLVTYVTEEEWKSIEPGQEVKIQGEMTGTILAASEVPTKNSTQLASYQKLQEIEDKESVAYYEVQISVDESLEDMPYGGGLDVKITTDEALNAVPIYKEWLVSSDEESVLVTKLAASGKGVVVTAQTPFMLKNHALLTDGIRSGDVVLNRTLKDVDESKVFLSYPAYKPTAKEWKNYGWRNYVKAMLNK